MVVEYTVADKSDFFFPEKYPFISYEQHYKKSKVIPFFIQHAEIHWICHNTAFARPS